MDQNPDPDFPGQASGGDILRGRAGRLEGEARLRAAADDVDHAVGESTHSGDLFRGVLESAPDGLVIVDRRGAIELVNARTESLFGYARRELLGRPVELLLPERFHGAHECHRVGFLSETRARAMGPGLDLYGRRKDGSEFPVEISLSPVRTEDGTLVAAAIRDVSERKRTQERIARLAAIVESSDDAVIGKTLDGTVVSWNPGAERMYGYGREEAIGRHISFLCPPGHEDEIPGLLECLERGERVEHFDSVRQRRNGSQFRVSLTVSPVIDASGTVVGASTIARDVSERQRATEKFRGLLESAPDAVVLVDDAGRIGLVNVQAERLLGYTRAELLGLGVEALIPERYRERHGNHRSSFFAEPDTRAMGDGLELFVLRRDGREVPVEISISPLETDEGMFVSAAIRDVTRRKRSEAALREAEERFRRVFEEAPVGIALITPELRVVEANQALCELTGYAEAELESRGLPDIIHPDDRAAHAALAEGLFAGRIPRYQVDQRYISKCGEIVWVSESATVIHDPELRGLVTVADISERKRFEGELRHLADHDALTGLFNRRRFYEEVDRELAVARRYRTGGAVLVLDLDHFKYVNDTRGHSAGDEFLAQTSSVLRSRLRETDILARLGGDEFGIALPHATEAQARRVAESLLQALHDEVHTSSPDRTACVTGSIGIKTWQPAEQLTSEDLLVAADIAMYEAKEAGRDRARVFDAASADQRQVASRMSWTKRLQQALDKDRFVLHAQPIVSLDGERSARHELLLRLQGDDGKLIPPSAFLYVAERFDVIEQIDRWVLHHAIQLLADAQHAGSDIRLNINLSARSIAAHELGTLFEQELGAASIDPHALCLEITETAAIRNFDRARRFAQHARALGCELALDDFGAGFASFYYLKHLAADYLKIDGEFITDLPESPINQLVVKAIVQIARGLGKQTIAEFVGGPDTVALLRDYGVDYAQGFYIAEPAPIDSITPHGQPQTSQ